MPTINLGANSNSSKTDLDRGDTVSFRNTSSSKDIDLTLPAIFDSQPTNPVRISKGNTTAGPYTVKDDATLGDAGYSWDDAPSITLATRTGTINVEQ